MPVFRRMEKHFIFPAPAAENISSWNAGMMETPGQKQNPPAFLIRCTPIQIRLLQRMVRFILFPTDQKIIPIQQTIMIFIVCRSTGVNVLCPKI